MLFRSDFESPIAQNYQIILPDEFETSLEFEGLVTELPLTIPTDDKITADVTIKITGDVVVPSGSSAASSGI